MYQFYLHRPIGDKKKYDRNAPIYTPPQKKCNFNLSIFPGVHGSPGSFQFCQKVFRVTCKRPHFKIPHGSLTILKSSQTNDKIVGMNANGANFFNVAFLLEKSVLCMSGEPGMMDYFGTVPVKVNCNKMVYYFYSL